MAARGVARVLARISDDAKAAYEEMARERDEQQRRYAAHLPTDKAR